VPKGGLDDADILRQAAFVHRAQLIQQDTRLLALERHHWPTTQWLCLAGDRRDDHPRQDGIHVIRRLA
jgi:hypothetical protein